MRACTVKADEQPVHMSKWFVAYFSNMNIIEALGNTDIYLIDQFMRGRILPGMRVLDAGCGGGRNVWLASQTGCHVYGVDQNPEAIEAFKENAGHYDTPINSANFSVQELHDMKFESDYFDLVICSAVLHFASSREHFTAMLKELVRVAKPGGMIWFRMTTKEALPDLGHQIAEDVYELPDGSTRYLLDKPYVESLMAKWGLSYLDPFKTVNVSDLRSMCVVCLGC